MNTEGRAPTTDTTGDREALREQVLAVVEEHISDCLDDPAGRDVDTESEALTDALLSGPLAGVLAENERMDRALAGLSMEAGTLRAERDALAAKVAAARALCDEWARVPARDLRTALNTPEGEKP